MTRILIFIFSLLSAFASAQLDREHWFAPMIDRTGQGQAYQALYLSTNEATPFTVEIYGSNVLLGSVSLSKGNPAKFTIPNREQIITTDPTQLFKPVNKGLYLKGAKAYYATLRFSVFNHAEIITSKGTSGLGKDFRAVMAPISAANAILNFTTGILATEDSTKVSVTEFGPNLAFSDGVPRTQFNITLQKGESYIIEGGGNNLKNWTAFIGAKIISDKPISVTNGNFNGQYATSSLNSSDILMDQAVPTDKLGQEFVLMKGNGDTDSGMESALVVATENNTNVYLNGNSVPVVTLNAGQHFVTDSFSYQPQGSGHYNMHVRTDKNSYVYQLLAGTDDGSPLATGGFNYIPPLSCYLPKRIEEIGRIDENEYEANGIPPTLSVPTKLNIITEKGATVQVFQNNTQLTLNPQNGPFPVTGTPNWVTYSINNIAGNVSIISSRAVTAGISAGNGAVGYGGYFAGFSLIPAIFKSSGECLPDVSLEVTAGFSSYLWLIKTPSGYVPAPGDNTKYQYKPAQAGIYAVKLKEGSCTEIQTPDYRFLNCDTFTNIDYNTCTSLTITPKFALSSQTLNNASVKIVKLPAKGTVTVSPTGDVIYTANLNATGTDTFSFSFCGIGVIPDCETVQATVNLKQIETYDAVLTGCSATNTAVFDLFKAAVTPETGVSKAFYKDAAFTVPISGAQAAAYTSAPGFVYVKLSNSFPCFSTAAIELKIQAPPVVQPQNYSQVHCDEEKDGIIDGIYHTDLDTVTPLVLPVNSGFTVKYYKTQQLAIAGGSGNLSGMYSFSAGAGVWIRVESPACPPEIVEIKFQTGAPMSVNSPVTAEICDNDLNNTETVNVSSYTSLFAATYDQVNVYDSLSKAQAGNPADAVSADQNVAGNATFYFRFHKTGVCDAIGTLNIKLKQPRTSPALVDKEICENTTTTLDAGSGFTSYLWNTGETTRTLQNVPIGEYWVDLESNGCVYRQFVKIAAAADPEIVRIDIRGSTVTVLVTGGDPPYRYSLDGGSFQDSNVFLNVSAGTHTIAVTSAFNCVPVTSSFYVMQLYNAISPNGDGKNDVLDYSGLLTKEEPQMQIFDRYGNLIFKGDMSNRFIWTATNSGKTVPTDTFWYVIRWREPKADYFTEYTGWVLVKNRN